MIKTKVGYDIQNWMVYLNHLESCNSIGNMLQGHNGGIKGFGGINWSLVIFFEIGSETVGWNVVNVISTSICGKGGKGNSRCLKPEREKSEKLRRKNETGNGANERAVSRFYLYDSSFSISSWRCLHYSSQWPNASWYLVFQHPNNVVHFERSIVAVWPFWPSAKGWQILLHQASPYMVHQLLRVLPCFQACRLLVSKLSWGHFCWEARESYRSWQPGGVSFESILRGDQIRVWNVSLKNVKSFQGLKRSRFSIRWPGKFATPSSPGLSFHLIFLEYFQIHWCHGSFL